MSQPPPPPPYARPPRRSGPTLWIVLGVVGGFVVLCCSGGFVLLALGIRAADHRLEEERANNTPARVGLGAAFEHDDFVVDAGWRVAREQGRFDIVGLALTNESRAQRVADLEFTLYRDGVRLGQVGCRSNTLGPEEESGAVDCFSADPFARGVDEVRVADSF